MIFFSNSKVKKDLSMTVLKYYRIETTLRILHLRAFIWNTSIYNKTPQKYILIVPIHNF